MHPLGVSFPHPLNPPTSQTKNYMHWNVVLDVLPVSASLRFVRDLDRWLNDCEKQFLPSILFLT